MLNQYTTTELVWEGPNIPCIQLCTGDTVSEVIYKIAEKICCIKDDLSLDKMSYECIIDKSRIYSEVDLFLLFSMLLKNDCDLYDLIQTKIDENDTTELLVDNLDLKCFLQSYLDEKCVIVRFYNNKDEVINPNHPNTVFQKANIKETGVFYVSDINQTIWIWNNVTQNYDDVTSTTNLNELCVCDINDLDLDLNAVLRVIITNLCQTKSNGVIKACDAEFKVVHFDTIDPNSATTFVGGDEQLETNYYISKVTHKIWRWVTDENSYLPSLLTSANIDLSSLDSCLLTQEISLQNWIDLYQVYEEPTIVSCLSTTLNTSTHLTQITDAAVCDLVDSVGSQSDVYYSSLGSCGNIVTFTSAPNSQNMTFSPNIPANVNYFYVNKDYPYPYIWNGALYVPYIKSLAFTEAEQWDKVCSILNRVKNVEQTCCTPTCDNTTIGFSVTYSNENNTFTLTFDAASGTKISDDFTDCGSVLTATDWKGNKVKLDIEITQDGEVEIDMSGLSIGKPVNINIKSCLSNGTLTCKNCISGLLPAIDLCGMCKICAVVGEESATDFVEIFYTVASQPSTLLSTQLKGGQCLTFSLPEDIPTIKSIRYSSSNITLENSDEDPCPDVTLPAPVTDSCWYFNVPVPTNTHKIFFKDTDALVTGIAGVYANPFYATFELNVNDDKVEDFFSYADYLHPHATTLISGKTALINNSNNPTTLFLPAVPLNIPVLDAQVCGGGVIETINNYPGTGGNGVTLFDPSPIGSSPQLVLDYTTTMVSTNFGFVLKVAGQPTGIPGIQQPEIAIKNPINGAISYIKGVLLADDCNCPSE